MKLPILDASALLALLWQEPGWEDVARVLEETGCQMSAVNLAEFVSKVQERQPDAGEIAALLDDFSLVIAEHDRAQAMQTGLLRTATRHLGLSLGDRACLALGATTKAPIYTADRPWLELAEVLGLDIRCIRPDSH